MRHMHFECSGLRNPDGPTSLFIFLPCFFSLFSSFFFLQKICSLSSSTRLLKKTKKTARARPPSPLWQLPPRSSLRPPWRGSEASRGGSSAPRGRSRAACCCSTGRQRRERRPKLSSSRLLLPPLPSACALPPRRTRSKRAPGPRGRSAPAARCRSRRGSPRGCPCCRLLPPPRLLLPLLALRRRRRLRARGEGARVGSMLSRLMTTRTLQLPPRRELQPARRSKAPRAPPGPAGGATATAKTAETPPRSRALPSPTPAKATRTPRAISAAAATTTSWSASTTAAR